MANFMAWMTAAALLAGAPEAAKDDAEASLEAFRELRRPLAVLSLDLQILDPRETRFVFIKAEEFQDDLKMLRRRGRELRDAPRVAEANRFPPQPVAVELLVKNRELLKALLKDGPPRDEAALKEVGELNRRFAIWDGVRDACSPYYYVTVRRQALLRLKSLLGAADFAAARLPAAVP